jgi:DNA-binding CsgD family transcriptional regulator
VKSLSIFEHILLTHAATGAPVADSLGIEQLWSMAASFCGDRETAISATQRHLDHAIRRDAKATTSVAQLSAAMAQIRHGDSAQALTLIRQSLRSQIEMGDRWGPVWSTHAVAWALAARLDRPDHNERQGPEPAQDIARLLGGAQRLREDIGVRLMGLGGFNAATNAATSAAIKILGPASYMHYFEQGSFHENDITQAYRKILDLAQAPSLEVSTSKIAEPDTDTEELTAREKEIAALITRGMTNPEIAHNLVISIRTVQTHVGNILRKRGFRNRQEVAVWFVRAYPD